MVKSLWVSAWEVMSRQRNAHIPGTLHLLLLLGRSCYGHRGLIGRDTLADVGADEG